MFPKSTFRRELVVFPLIAVYHPTVWQVTTTIVPPSAQSRLFPSHCLLIYSCPISALGHSSCHPAYHYWDIYSHFSSVFFACLPSNNNICGICNLKILDSTAVRTYIHAIRVNWRLHIVIYDLFIVILLCPLIFVHFEYIGHNKNFINHVIRLHLSIQTLIILRSVVSLNTSNERQTVHPAQTQHIG